MDRTHVLKGNPQRARDAKTDNWFSVKASANTYYVGVLLSLKCRVVKVDNFICVALVAVKAVDL